MLIDLGFGSYGISDPLALDSLGVETQQGFDSFKLTCLDNQDYLLQALVAGVWANQYSFDLSAQEWVDFDPANYMNSTHPDAVFVKSLLVIRHQAEGRYILFGNSLKTIRNGNTTQRTVEPGEIDGLLHSLFGLKRPQLA